MTCIRTTRPLATFLVPGLALALAMVAPSAAPAQLSFGGKVTSKDSSLFLSTFREVVAQARRSTVPVLCNENPSALGTVVDGDGLVLTKASELRGEITCLVRGRPAQARLVAQDDTHDLALLKVDATGLTPVSWARSKTLGAGMWLASVGPTPHPVAVGVVSVPTRDMTAWDLPPNVNPNGGFLGIATDLAEDGGVAIVQVVPESAAFKAKLKDGDLLLAIGKKKVSKPEDVFQALRGSRPDDRIRIKVAREGTEMELTATLGKRPAQTRSEFQNSLGSELSDRRTGFPTILQHDAVIKPEDCGGPIVTLDGKAVGINIARAGRTESYAIPSEAVIAMLADYRAGKLALNTEGGE